jgi:hypothetical protein
MVGVVTALSGARLSRAGRGDDQQWAVVVWLGTQRRIAEIFPSRAHALADCAWREAEVAAYLHLLRGTGQPVPRYLVAPMRRADLPKSWRPLPALGFLHVAR